MTTRSKSSVPEPLFRTPDPVDVPGAWFDQAAVDRVVKFGRYCRHTKGRWAGLSIDFEPWQIEHVIAPAFGWKYPNGLRIRRKIYVEVAKKNGKSTMASVIGLYLTGPDREPGAEVYSAAAAKDQARIVHEPARLMVERSPKLAKRFRKFRNTITYPETDGKFEVISASADLQDGLNVHGWIIDEVHRHRSRDLIEILEFGTAAREQPLGFLITTAGEQDDSTIYAELHTYCRQVADRIIRDPSFHGVIFAASPGDDYTEEATWAKANPNMGVTVMPEYLAGKAAEADSSPAKLNGFLRFHLNIRTRQTIRWHSIDVWDASRGTVKADELEGKVCYGGLSVARSQDVGAFVLDFPQSDGSHRVLWRFWLPEDLLPALDERTNGQGSRWVRDGRLELTPGDVIDYAAVRSAIEADASRYDVAEIAYNRRGARQLAQDLAENGLEMVEMQAGITLAASTQEWERLILSRAYQHGGHPVARWMFDGLAVKQDAEGNVWPDQGKSRANVSGCVAAVMALDRAVRNSGSGDLSSAVW